MRPPWTLVLMHMLTRPGCAGNYFAGSWARVGLGWACTFCEARR